MTGQFLNAVALCVGWAVLLSCVSGQMQCQETGWFGTGCVYMCRCAEGKPCDAVTGLCPNNACSPGWFGPSCQHADLAHQQPVTALNGAAWDDRNARNGSSDTCAVTRDVQVTLDKKHTITWIRIVTPDTSAWNQVRLYVTNRSDNSTQECTGEGSAVVQWERGRVVDIHCRQGVSGDTVRLDSGNITSSVCSVHVDGGRNMALRGLANQIGTDVPRSADRSVDGGTDQSLPSSTCSRTSDNDISFGCTVIAMTTNPWWQVVLPTLVKVTRFKVYSRRGSVQLLVGLQVYWSRSDPQYSLLYRQPGNISFPDILHVSLDTPVLMDRVALQIPGQCQILDFCELEVFGDPVCPSNRYGLQCQDTCQCRDVTEVCQTNTGGCVSGCPDGYTGLACDQKCNITHYGKDCQKLCGGGCQDGLCDHVTGRCTLGCKDGWHYEPLCELECVPGFWGTNCTQPCPENCLNGTCNAIGLCDRCEPGYRDFKCDQECAAGTFGIDCQERCSFHCEILKCNHVTGACSCRAGWKLDQCVDPCDSGTWGPNCTVACSNGCQQQECDAINGVCQYGCQRGFLGEFCDEPCRTGTFGDDCGEVCSARCVDSLCNHVNGACLSCPPGFTDNFCQTPCQAGRWGSRCREQCSIHCGGPGDACSTVDGTCNDGCDDGFTDSRCSQECLRGTYGQNCSQNCSQFCLAPAAGNVPCNHVTGYCPQGCADGYKGPACLTKVPAVTALTAGVAAGLVVAVIAILILVVLFVMHRRRKSLPKTITADTQEENGQVRLSAAYANINHAYVTDGKDSVFDDEDEASDVGISMATGSEDEREKQVYYNTCAELSRTRIATSDLISCLYKWRVDPLPLVEQFENLPKGLISTTSIALNVANKGKNRYKNICAYDHSRVKLNIIDGDPNSDYINSSYISGYDGKAKFIASQGPNGIILNDFLRMLWEKRVTTVVMLTNRYEGGKHKCEQYWPDVGEKKFGTVTVTLLSTRQTADYVIRTLQLAKEGRKIQVKQHHFTSWPDKGVPPSPWPLVDFHMVVSAHVRTQPDDVPIVVHCSAGIGRTGTYISLDILLTEATAAMSLDFNSCVWKLRQARVNMVQTVEQYMFLHEAVLIGLAVSGSLHKKDILPDVVMELSKPTAEGFTKMAGEYKRLGMCQWKVDEEDYKAGREDDNIAKNRYYNILPKDKNRPLLSTSVAGTNDYINAVFLPGYRKSNHFIVTQMPLASTVLDVWRLVGEHPVSTIVVFPATPTTVGDTAPEFLPEQGQTSVFGSYKVTGRSYTQHQHYEEGFLYMVKSKRLSFARNGRVLHVLKCKESNPNSDIMLAVAEAAIFGVPDKQLEESMILVVCRTGAEMSGVFVTVAQLIQRMGEAAVSVPTVVGHLRTVRPQLVSSMDQYQTIYEAVKQYAIKSCVYTNMEVIPPPKPLRKGEKERRQASNEQRKAVNGQEKTEGGERRATKTDDSKEKKVKKKEKAKENGHAQGEPNGSSLRVTGRSAQNSINGRASSGGVNGVAPGNAAVAKEEDRKEGHRNDVTSDQGRVSVKMNGKGSVKFSM